MNNAEQNSTPEVKNEEVASQESQANSEIDSQSAEIPAEEGQIPTSQETPEQKQEKRRYNTHVRKLEERINQLQNLILQGTPAGQPLADHTAVSTDDKVFDPVTRKYYAKNSPIGTMIDYQNEVKRIQEQELRQREMAQAQEKALRVRQVLDDAIDNIPGFEEAYQFADNRETGFTEIMTQALLEVDSPVAVIQYFKKNPTEMARIRKLSPMAQVKEMGRIEDRMKANPRLNTKAPEPVGQTKSGRLSNAELSNLSPKQYEEYMKNLRGNKLKGR